MDQDVERLKICLHVFGCPAHIYHSVITAMEKTDDYIY